MKANYSILIILFLITNNALAAITCFNPVEVCVEAGGTRDFNGASLYLPCWKYKTTYTCKADSDNNCKQLAADGCSPSTTICRTWWGSVCAVNDVTYDCPTRKCDGTEIVCNSGGGFCLTGDCAQQTRSVDPDMYKALSALSAAAEAAKAFREQLTIFKGKSNECSKNIVGFKNCCGRHAKGWGEGILVECTSDEEQLAIAKDAGFAAEVGTYCYNKVLGKCTSEHTTYCIFGSKLGRIIRVAANSQLGLSFGDPEHPDCSGLTPEQFQRMDFSKIDFSEFYEDIKKNQTVKLADVVNPVMQQKIEGLKTKLQGDAQKTKERTDELRVRK